MRKAFLGTLIKSSHGGKYALQGLLGPSRCSLPAGLSWKSSFEVDPVVSVGAMGDGVS